MVEAVGKGLFQSFLAGKDRIKISHLQFVDDALFMGCWSSKNVSTLLNLLFCFGDASSLHINLQKSRLFGIGVSATDEQRLATQNRCSAGFLPFFLSWSTYWPEYAPHEKLGYCGG